MKTDTIAAIATAMSPSGIGIIRISGEDAIEITDKIYRSKNNKKKISECKSHTIHYGYIYDGDEKIDEVMVVVMRAPATYTREDTIEIDCHGGVFVMKRILETVIKNGARPAEPGEYTKRAFLNVSYISSAFFILFSSTFKSSLYVFDYENIIPFNCGKVKLLEMKRYVLFLN